MQDYVNQPNQLASTRLLAEPDFWRLWLIGTIQFSVRWIEMLAVAIFVYQQSGSALQVTVMTMLRVLPMALFGAFIGAAADRMESRTALLLNVLALLATSVTVTLLAYTGQLVVWHLALASFVSGTVWSADNPLRRLMIGRVAGASRVATAMAFDTGANTASRMAGPAIGGLVLANWGIGACFALGALLYLVSFSAVVGIRYRNPVIAKPGLMLRSILDAIGLVKRDPRLVAILTITVIFNLFGWPCLSLVPVIGHDSLGLGANGVGLLASMEGVGALVGVVAVHFMAKAESYGKLFVTCVFVYLFALASFALLPHAWLAGVALLVAGLGGAGFGIMQSTLIFHVAQPEMRARMLGLLSVSIGTGPIGFLQIGLLADIMGSQGAILLATAEGLLALALTRRFWREI